MKKIITPSSKYNVDPEKLTRYFVVIRMYKESLATPPPPIPTMGCSYVHTIKSIKYTP